MNFLITGGTGSLGHALVRHFQPTCERVIVYSRDELKQAEMAKEFPQANVRFFLGDVRDRERLIHAFDGVDVVVHAAALKRIDDISYNPAEALKTNVLGTQNVLEAALATGTDVLFISSDKAVEPVNYYGATKLMGEFLTVAANVLGHKRGTRASVLRYGNVWGSRGSVVHLFRAQAAAGLQLTVTDPLMTRFFITLPQAAAYVERCIDVMTGGEIFVPLLPAWSVRQVASKFSQNWQIVGLRPGGEKIHEKLVSSNEERHMYYVPDDTLPMYVVSPEPCSWMEKHWAVDHLRRADRTVPYTSNEVGPVSDRLLRQALEDL